MSNRLEPVVSRTAPFCVVAPGAIPPLAARSVLLLPGLRKLMVVVLLLVALLLMMVAVVVVMLLLLLLLLLLQRRTM